MKLARIADNEPFYSVVIDRAAGQQPDQPRADVPQRGAELFDFAIIVPNTLRPDMPLSHREYLPVLMRMQERAGMIPRAQSRFQDAPDDEYRSFRRPFAGEILLPPVAPLALRRFNAFEAHTLTLRQQYGLTAPGDENTPNDTHEDMPLEVDEPPLFTFANPSSLVGQGASVAFPHAGQELDFGLELAVIIGKTGQDIPIGEADGYIAGFALCNGWCLRDVERREMRAGVGPGKSRDFAMGLGPALVTPDELADRILAGRENGRVYDVSLTASVNGREIGTGNVRDMRWTFAQLIACASRDAVLHPGDVISSGTMHGGCLLDHPHQTHPWLVPGDVVRLEAERLGVLENTIVSTSSETIAA